MDINTTRLRCLLGWLAMLLAWIVTILYSISIQSFKIPDSISDTFYTNAGSAFMIILGASAILLISYKGYEKVDDITTTITGILGLCICAFPCYPIYQNPPQALVGMFSTPRALSSTLHGLSAVVFFVLLAYNSFFLFTKSNGEMTKNKKIRNIIFRVCAVGMLLSFALLLLPSFRIQIWLVEMIALTFFGVSWLTKANYYPWLFADKK